MLLESERDLVYDDPILAAGAPARSLASANDEYVIDGTLVRNIDKVTEASVSLRFDQTDSLSLLGPRNGNPDDPRRRDRRRSEERRVGKECARMCRSRGQP